MNAALAILQRDFLASLLDGEPAAFAAQPDDAMDFYRGAVEATREAALAAAYPVVERLVGEAFFGEAAHAYARAHPSTSGDLHGFGHRFAEFIGAYVPAASLEYLADVARLEWAVHESAHAADARAFDFAALASIPESAHGKLCARLAPATRCLRSCHPVVAIFEANAAGRDGVPERLEGPDHVMVRRADGNVAVERVDAAAWRFLAALARGEALESASACLEEHEARMPALLAGWIATGVIEALEPGDMRG